MCARKVIKRSAGLNAVNGTLIKSFLALSSVSAILLGSAASFFKTRTTWYLLPLLGAGCLIMVVLAHMAEAQRVFPWMGWGQERSIGHYLDFFSAVLGMTLFPIEYLLQSVREVSK
jgi:hypothetical protein